MIDSIQVSPDDPDFKRILNKRLEEISSLLGRPATDSSGATSGGNLLAGTNKQRESIPPGSYEAGTTFWETDTKTMYVVDVVGSGHAWVNVAGGGGGGGPTVAAIEYATGSLTLLVNTLVDIPGCSITLGRGGDWLITGNFAFHGQAAGDAGAELRGYLEAAGSAQTNYAVFSGPFGATATIGMASQQWIVTAANGDVMQLQGSKNSGTGGSTAGLQTSIVAQWLNP